MTGLLLLASNVFMNAKLYKFLDFSMGGRRDLSIRYFYKPALKELKKF
jgi:hypothetical protein